MKKNIVIAILAIGLVMLIVFGVYQHTEANRQEALAVANAAEAATQTAAAEVARNEAEMQRALAMKNEMEAQMHLQIAEEALRKCRGK